MFNACRGLCSIFDIFKKPAERQNLQIQQSREHTIIKSKSTESNVSLSEQELFNLQNIDQEDVLRRLQQFLNKNKVQLSEKQIFDDDSSIQENQYYEYLYLLNEIQKLQSKDLGYDDETKLQQHQLRLKHNIAFIKKLAQYIHRRFFKSNKLNIQCKELKIIQLQKLIQNAITNTMYLSLHLNQIQNSLLQYQFLTNFKELITLMGYYLQAQEYTFKTTQNLKKKYNQDIHQTLVKIQQICQDVLVDDKCENLLLDWKTCLKKIIEIYTKCDNVLFDMSSIEQEIVYQKQKFLMNYEEQDKGVYFDLAMPLKRTSSYVKEIKVHDLTRSSSIDSKTSDDNYFDSFYKGNQARLLKLNLQQMGDLAF